MPPKHPSRRPRSKAELLPLPAAHVRAISLGNHLALATIRSGHGSSETMITLLRALYLTFYILEPEVPDVDLALFLEVESVLQHSIGDAAAGRNWGVLDEHRATIARLLLRTDVLVSQVPKYRYVQAWNKLCRFACSAEHSPLPGSQLAEVWQ
ncbi:hypothetical protein [Burkholderia pyrrocinia]|uniref:hypothetical protein n=1 Tax=Burkholderia pyrrocinia TaxID=60550 RepID=UPI001FC81665|nr:hypothetical protein [Burkholderia pyrrocinia]